MAPLHGIGVLVTRPEDQAQLLCRLLQAQGAHTLRLPAIDIRPCGDERARRTQLEALAPFDIVVFTSANAVRFGHQLLERSAGACLAAIGPATARALGEYGHGEVLRPGEGFTSEALLAHSRFRLLAGQRILLIKGADGRAVLEHELLRRGAAVLALDVYQRTAATPSAADLAAVQAEFAADRLHVITATSLQIGRHLLELAAGELRAPFEKALWLVPGERIAAGLRAQGLRAPLLTAASAEDHDLVAALALWRANGSRA